MIDEKKIYNYIKELINPYGKPFEGTSYELGNKIMDYIKNMEKIGEWIPVICRETTEEDGIDKERYPFFLDCRLPEDEQEIIICMKNGHVCTDISFNGDGCYLDSGRDWMDAIAWQPLPEPYKPKGE